MQRPLLNSCSSDNFAVALFPKQAFNISEPDFPFLSRLLHLCTCVNLLLENDKENLCSRKHVGIIDSKNGWANRLRI